MNRRLFAVRSLSPGDWLLLAQAWLLLLVVDLGLRCFPFKRVRAILAAPDLPAPPTDATAVIRRTTRSVDIAARHHLYPMTCLRCALALQRLLAGRGLVTELKWGVRRDDARLNAHAWLEYDGAPIGESLWVAHSFAPLLAPRSKDG